MFEDLSQHKEYLDTKLKKSVITPKLLFNNCAFLFENSKQAPAFYDNTWSTLYYFLGEIYHEFTENICEVNFSLGLFSYAYLRKKSNIKYFCGFYPKQEKQNIVVPMRLGRANIKKKAKKAQIVTLYGNLYDDDITDKLQKNKLDLLIFSEINSYNKTLEMLDFFYPSVRENGLVVIDEYNHKEVKEAVDAFAFSKNKKLFTFKTRYGTAILQK